jgi:hypothetical protein
LSKSFAGLLISLFGNAKNWEKKLQRGPKRTADYSSPAKLNPTQPAKKKANLSDKEKEIDLFKHQLNEQSKIKEKI